MPKRPCSGVESTNPLCTGDAAEGLWGAAYAQATQRLNFTYDDGAPTWAILINGPNRRGVHQVCAQCWLIACSSYCIMLWAAWKKLNTLQIIER